MSTTPRQPRKKQKKDDTPVENQLLQWVDPEEEAPIKRGFIQIEPPPLHRYSRSIPKRVERMKLFENLVIDRRELRRVIMDSFATTSTTTTDTDGL